jgi:NAD-dependent deacetylase
MSEPIPLVNIPENLTQTLRSARCITVLTGAGISAESGIPTFRDSQTGLWAQYDPRQLATPEAFAENPKLVLDWYRWRRVLVQKSTPNRGHIALVELEQRVPNFILITQNVDGLHRSAGSQNMIELHGNINHLRCSSGQDHSLHDWSDLDLPTCPTCGSLLRPDIVWFGEALASTDLERAVEATHGCDLFLSIGTSGMVEPAASLPYEAQRSGSVVVEINPTPTPLTVYARYSLPHPAGLALPQLIRAAFP